MKFLGLSLPVAILLVAAYASPAWVRSRYEQPSKVVEVVPPSAVSGLRAGWRLSHVKTMPEPINSLMVAPGDHPDFAGLVFAGLSGTGAIYRVTPTLPTDPLPVAQGLGDMIRFGLCNVSHMAFHDMDGDGTLELLGSTSQVEPTGRPRLCVLSSSRSAPALRAVARPEIASSWSHSMGFLPRPGNGPDSVFITFCGHGEVVEYRMNTARSADGFGQDTLGWKQVGQLPASGEWLQVADADNDGRAEVCVATGFMPGQAAIYLYHSDAPGAELVTAQKLDEGGRFGNVRFLVADLQGDGRQDILAWWCTDISGGECEMIRYRLGPEGVSRRTVLARGPAIDWWCDDGRFTSGDLDGDGQTEVYFATCSGSLFRYDPRLSPTPQPLARFHIPIGALTAGNIYASDRQRLYIGSDRSILSLDAPAL